MSKTPAEMTDVEYQERCQAAAKKQRDFYLAVSKLCGGEKLDAEHMVVSDRFSNGHSAKHCADRIKAIWNDSDDSEAVRQVGPEGAHLEAVRLGLVWSKNPATLSDEEREYAQTQTGATETVLAIIEHRKTGTWPVKVEPVFEDTKAPQFRRTARKTA